MRPVAQLVQQFQSRTPLQRDELSRSLVEDEIEIIGSVSDIAVDHIAFTNLSFKPELRWGTKIRVDYAGNEFRSQLLKYSPGDVLRAVAVFQGFSIGSAYYDFGEDIEYRFKLKSVTRVHTIDENVHLEAMERKRVARREVLPIAVGASGVWLVGGAAVGTLVSYVLKWLLDTPLATSLPVAYLVAILVAAGVGTMMYFSE